MDTSLNLQMSAIAASRTEFGNERYHGALVTVRDSGLTGWLVDVVDPVPPIGLTIGVEGILLDEIVTSLRRKDLAKIAEQNCAGFRLDFSTLPLPRRLALRECIEELLAADPKGQALVVATISSGPGASLNMSRRFPLEDFRAALPSLMPADTAEEMGAYVDGMAIIHDLRRDVRSGPRFRGGFDGIFGTQLRCWIIDLFAPNEHVPLSISIEGVGIGETTTDLHRNDIAGFFPKNRAGLVFDLATLPVASLDQIRKALARDTPLAPIAISIHTKQGRARLITSRSGITRQEFALRLQGAVGRSAPAKRPAVEEERRFRPVRTASGKLRLNPALRPISDLRDLQSGPQFRGGLDGFRQGQIAGWLVDLAAPSEALALDVSLEGMDLRPVKTSIHRDDMVAFLPSNVCGFVVDLVCESATRLRSVAEKLLFMPPE